MAAARGFAAVMCISRGNPRGRCRAGAGEEAPLPAALSPGRQAHGFLCSRSRTGSVAALTVLIQIST
ncbi:hypothetical protein GRJ2_001880100 [Grus japonensis]|uniref:Uncharacterized protein n=1 Tax=Grus japonensis TaxID=30415 RepID=A0ABC9X8W2_GRUJA